MKKILNEKYGHLAEFVGRLPEGGFEEGGKLLYDVRNKVKLFEVCGQKVVVKRFRQPSGLNRFIYSFFRETKAKRAYNNATILENYGILTPAAIAYIEIREKGLITESYLVTEYTDFKPYCDLIHEEKYIQAMGFNKHVEFAIRLHEMGINHKDFTNTNVRYRLNDDLTFDFLLIDINRMSFGHQSRWKCMADFKKVAEDSDSILAFSQKYAEKRGWNHYYSLAIIAMYRGMWEQRKKTKSYLKQLIRSNA